MIDHERRLLLRGMSVANGLLVNTSCTHRRVISEYQQILAEACGIDDGDTAHREEFKQLVSEMNQAIAAKYPDAVSVGGAKPPRCN
jgi:hypothetical protein